MFVDVDVDVVVVVGVIDVDDVVGRKLKLKGKRGQMENSSLYVVVIYSDFNVIRSRSRSGGRESVCMLVCAFVRLSVNLMHALWSVSVCVNVGACVCSILCVSMMNACLSVCV